jgi:hypothetical protein
VKEIGSGAAFGEMSLMYDHLRSATIQWKKETWIGILEKTDYTEILGNNEKRILNEKIKFMAQIQLFSKWSKTSIHRLLFHFQAMTFKRN